MGKGTVMTENNTNGLNLDLDSFICSEFGKEKIKDPKQVSPLVLAYIGDAVYEIIIRTLLLNDSAGTVQNYHKKCISYVNCAKQREIIMSIEEELTEDEMNVFKRGRNAKSYTMPKNATPSDYRNATGFEALCGYLYLMGKIDRLTELLKKVI